MKVFITFQFSYCPLIWILHGRTLNKCMKGLWDWNIKITSLHLKNFQDYSVTVHHKNLQVLVTEIFKVKNGLAPDIIKDVFGLREPYTTYGQNQITLQVEMLRLLTMVSYLTLQIWELVPHNVGKWMSLKLRSNPGNQVIVHLGSPKLV